MHTKGRVHKKNAIITGGGNSIGKAIAKRFAEEGAQVLITDCNQHDGMNVAKGSGAISCYHQDVTVETDWQRLFKFALEKFSRVDILVNNAAILATETSQLLEDTSLKQWRAVQSVNSEGVFLGCKYGVEAMRETGGSIINLSSIAGIISSPHLVAYGLKCKIKWSHLHGGDISEKRRDMINLIPLGEAGTAEDIANGALFLASDEASHITGVELVIDGGMTIV